MSSSAIESDVEDICEDLADAFSDDAGVDLDLVVVSFYDEDSDLLDSYEYDVADQSLD